MVKIQVIGHLGKDAVVNTVSGKTVINFAVAHTEKYKDVQGNVVSKTIWVDCAQWTDKTGLVPYLKKGTQVYVEGQPDVQTYSKDGIAVGKLVCRVSSIQLLGGATGEVAPAVQSAPAENYYAPIKEPEKPNLVDADDLPF